MPLVVVIYFTGTLLDCIYSYDFSAFEDNNDDDDDDDTRSHSLPF